MNQLARLGAAVLPLLGLAVLWGISDHTYRQGTEWEVPIEGYDPRDYLRGHYVQFTYDWPGLDPDNSRRPAMLCLVGQRPTVASVTIPETESELATCDNPLRAAPEGVYGWQGLARGRLYIGQDRAAALQEQLRNRDLRGIVTIRLREDGSFTPIAIRFRPLTAQEIAERDGPAEGAEDLRPPPAIMTR